MESKYIFDGHKLNYHTDRLNGFLSEGDCFPVYMEISPVGSCNHRCVFCAYDFIGHPNRKLESVRFLKFIDEISECNIKSLLYAGEGEPLMHPDIDKFILHSRNNKIDVGIFTNGHLLKEELTEKILSSLVFIRFSFNGGTRESYSQMHQVKQEAFDRVIKNIMLVVQFKEKEKLSLDIGAQYVLLPENIDCLFDAIKLLKNIGIDYFVIKPFVQQSSSQFYQMKEQFNLENIKGVLEKAESFSDDRFTVIARKESFMGYGKRNYKNCYGTSFISVLNSAGDIASCLPYWEREEFVFGNIYKNSFKEIWFGERRKKIREYLENKLDMASCPPNCRSNAINEFLYEIKNPSVRHLNFI